MTPVYTISPAAVRLALNKGLPVSEMQYGNPKNPSRLSTIECPDERFSELLRALEDAGMEWAFGGLNGRAVVLPALAEVLDGKFYRAEVDISSPGRNYMERGSIRFPAGVELLASRAVRATQRDMHLEESRCLWWAPGERARFGIRVVHDRSHLCLESVWYVGVVEIALPPLTPIPERDPTAVERGRKGGGSPRKMTPKRKAAIERMQAGRWAKQGDLS